MKFLITVKYYNGTVKTFYLTAEKLLSAERLFMSKYNYLLVDAEQMSTETI